MTPVYPPDAYNVEAVAAMITSRLVEFVERHWAADCYCGKLNQSHNGPYIGRCDEAYNECQPTIEAVLSEHPLPSEPADLLRYLTCHPEIWEWHPNNTNDLASAVGSIVEEQIDELVAVWIDGCYVAKLLAEPPEAAMAQLATDYSPDWDAIEAVFTGLMEAGGSVMYPYWDIEHGRTGLDAWVGLSITQYPHFLADKAAHVRWHTGQQLVAFDIGPVQPEGLPIRLVPENQVRRCAPMMDVSRLSFWEEDDLTYIFLEMGIYVSSHYGGCNPIKVECIVHCDETTNLCRWEFVLFGDCYESDADDAEPRPFKQS